MKKSEALKGIYQILNDYSSLIETGFTEQKELPDLSFWDIAVEKIPIEKINKLESKVIEQSTNPDNMTKGKIENININDYKKRDLYLLANEIMKCTKCSLNSKKIVGLGNYDSNILVVSDYKISVINGEDTVLTNTELDFFLKWISAIKLSINDIFLTSVLKCQILSNKFGIDEIEKCRSYINREIEITKPKLILCLGEVVLSSLSRKFVELNTHHGKIFYYGKIPFIATYHPRDVMKNQDLKRDVWEDLKVFRKNYDMLINGI